MVERKIDFEGGCRETHSSGFTGPFPRSHFDRQSVRDAKKIGSGLPAGPGAASGHVVFSAEEAVAVRRERRKGCARSRGNFSGRSARHDRGRRHPHRARRCVLARRAGRAANGQGLRLRRQRLQIDYQKNTLSANGTTLNEGDYISIDGTSGEVFAGEVTTAPSEIVQVLVDRSLDAKKSRFTRITPN